MNLVLTYDSSVTSLSQSSLTGFYAVMNQAIAYFDSLITNNITVTIQVSLGGSVTSGAEGGPSGEQTISYNDLKNILAANASSPAQLSVLANLPATDPTGGQGYAIANAQAKALGLMAADSSEVDGTVAFAWPNFTGTSNSVGYSFSGTPAYNQASFLAIVEHELSHAMGRIISFGGSSNIMNLVDYTAPGVLASNQNAKDYFSVNGGANSSTAYVFDTTSDPGDWASSSNLNDSFDAYAPDGVLAPVSATDQQVINAIGFETASSLGDLTSTAFKSTYETIWNSGTGVLQVVNTASGNAVVSSQTFSGDLFSGNIETVASDGASGTFLGLLPLAFVNVASGDIVYSNVQGQPYTAFEQLFAGSAYLGADYIYTTVPNGATYTDYETKFSAGNNYIGAAYLYTNGNSSAAFSTYTLQVDGSGRLVQASFGGMNNYLNYAFWNPGQYYFESYLNDYVGGVYADSKYDYVTIPTGATYNSFELDVNHAGALTATKFFFTGVTGQSFTSQEVDLNGSGVETRVLYTGMKSTPYSSLEMDFTSGSYSGYKLFYTGITGQSYTSLEADFTSANVQTKTIYSGMSTPYSSEEIDYSGGVIAGSIYTFTNVTGQTYYAYQMTENASGTGVQVTADLNNGGHKIQALVSGQTLSSVGDDLMIGSSSGATTFLFNPIYGADEISNFTTADTISMASSEFANFGALQGAAVNSGANVLITATDGDTLQIDNMTKATLTSLSANFTFHA